MIERTWATATCAFFVSFFAACDGAAGGAEWAGTMRDSAGVVIVENPTTEIWTDRSRPSVRETLRIGSIGGAVEEQFGLIAGLDVDSQGRIYILDQQARRVRVFDASGSFVRELGGRVDTARYHAGDFGPLGQASRPARR